MRRTARAFCETLAILRVATAHALALLALPAAAQVETSDSGGPLMPEQAAYDVTYYDLAIAIDPETRSIEGAVRTVARVGSPLSQFVLDLDDVFHVSAVTPSNEPEIRLSFQHANGKIRIDLPATAQPGEIVDVTVAYAGVPRVAQRPPWDGGFQWARTPSGAHWIATSCQGEGADIWWPLKEHVSDEPDSVSLHFTVPDPLVVATNGRMTSVVPNADGTSTWNWFVSTPINTYNVALNIAPYELIEEELESVAGDMFPVQFFVLPEDLEKGRAFFPEILDHVRFFEEYLGPYPFRADKYGVAQTPHLGMEHQTIIAYGANFSRTAMSGGDMGFDSLHHHELSHEWWGNLVTNFNWNDMWLHEGFGTYMQPLYIEYLSGREAYLAQFAHGHRFQNAIPVAPREILSSSGIYSTDIYYKGSWVLHTLRYLIGEEPFFTALRRMAYPTPEMESVTDGSQTRFATTDDFVRLVNQISGRDLSWFFEAYIRRAPLPSLRMTRSGTRVELAWSASGLPFPMPIDVWVDGEARRVEMPDGRALLTVPEIAEVLIDPTNLVLRKENERPPRQRN